MSDGAAATPARSRGALGRALLVGVLAWLVGWPLLVTLLEALGGPGAWSAAPFVELARRPETFAAAWASLWISLASTALAAAIGVPLALLFGRYDFPARRLLGTLVALPVALPPLVGVIAFLFLFGESGFVAHLVRFVLRAPDLAWSFQGALAILVVHAYSFYVYFYLLVRAGIARLDPSLEEAAAALGAGRLRILRAVVLPQLYPALAGGALLTFMTSLASFTAPYIFGGGFRVLPTQIVASKLNGDVEMAQVEALVLAAMAGVALAVLRAIERRAAGGSVSHGIAPARPRVPSRSVRIAATVAGWGAAALLLAPHATLLLLSFVPRNTWTTEVLPPVLATVNYRDLLADAERLRPIANSLWMASLATVGALVLGGLAAWEARRRTRVGAALEVLVGLPWAVPGTVFAIALATAMSVDAPLELRFLLVGTPWILVLGYLAHALPMTGRATLAGVRRLDPALEEAAASLGAGPWRTLRRVVLPLVAPALAAGAGLAFVSTLGDFVTSIVLYTYESRPISVEIYSDLRIQELGLASAYGVLLVVASAVGFWAWGRGEELSE